METIILFIIIAAISAIFNKAKERPADSKRRTIPELKKEFQEVYKEISQSEIPKSLKELEQRRKQQVQIPNREAAHPVEAAPKISSGKQLLKEQPVMVNEERKPSLEKSEKDLADAVIWAEILGPPRSKRPYYRR
ncbi:hypothetical protein A8F94_04655 [Bacillus sp. FJAT-27225]|uniref:hypothetical protein n=1 Tax=Bacillus sp. FJAT-27225 TaxID=1743144 RepID=UPI00080C219F|nr:hypothetical protein [Bacillus sp. FJAT-27225]OCA91153.1 hypothetical protein A8F94_04655 [Bacillus sp. FJAT-27225]